MTPYCFGKGGAGGRTLRSSWKEPQVAGHNGARALSLTRAIRPPTLNPMEVHFTPEIEAQLRELAAKEEMNDRLERMFQS